MNHLAKNYISAQKERVPFIGVRTLKSIVLFDYRFDFVRVWTDYVRNKLSCL